MWCGEEVGSVLTAIWILLQQRGVYTHLPLWEPSECSEISAWVLSVSSICRKLRCLKREKGFLVNILTFLHHKEKTTSVLEKLSEMKGRQLAYIHFSFLTYIFPTVHFITDTKRNKFSFQKIRSKIKFAFVKKGSRITLELHWYKGSGVIK